MTLVTLKKLFRVEVSKSICIFCELFNFIFDALSCFTNFIKLSFDFTKETIFCHK